MLMVDWAMLFMKNMPMKAFILLSRKPGYHAGSGMPKALKMALPPNLRHELKLG